MSNELVLINQLRRMKAETELAISKKYLEAYKDASVEKALELERKLKAAETRYEEAKVDQDEIEELQYEITRYREFLEEGEDRGLVDIDNIYAESGLKWIDKKPTNGDAREQLEEIAWNIKQKISDQEYRDFMDVLAKM